MNALQQRAWRVTGHVQGVGFRASTREVARRLGLGGSVENLPDGSVQVQACGASDALDQLAEWLTAGPRYSNVESVVQLRDETVEGGHRADGHFEVR